MARPTGKGLNVEIEGDEELKRKLEKASISLKDFRGVFRNTARKLRRRMRKVFMTQGRSQGTPWASLSPYTMKAKRKGWGRYQGESGYGILRSSGRLMASYTNRGHSRHVEKIYRQSMEWGSNHPTAHLHAQGPQSRGPAPPLPQRPLVALSDKEEREFFRDPLATHVLGRLSRSRG